MFDALFESIFSDKALQATSLADLARTGRSNDYLLADANSVGVRTNGDAVVIEGLDAESVAAAISAYAGENGGQVRNNSALSGLFIIRTKTMRFPDGLYYWMEPVEGGVKLSLYSRSVFGRSDLGVNKARVRALLSKLGQ